jgi:hypothetical protein
MDQLQLYREEAKKRYIDSVTKQEEEELQKKRENDEKEDEYQIILNLLQHWDDILQSYPILSHSIEFISLEVKQHLCLFNKHEMKDDLQKRALQLMNIVNSQQEHRNTSA